jgi:hypothetical protein
MDFVPFCEFRFFRHYRLTVGITKVAVDVSLLGTYQRFVRWRHYVLPYRWFSTHKSTRSYYTEEKTETSPP